jgi:hypothetical protein
MALNIKSGIYDLKNFYGNPNLSPCTKHLSSGLQHDLAQAIP